MRDDDWPPYRRPMTGQPYSEPCRCPHCLQREANRLFNLALDRHTHEYEMGAANAPPLPPEEETP